MAIITQIEQRLISGLGSLRVPDSEQRDDRLLILVSELVRPPRNRYQNFDWFPPREVLGRLTFRSAGAVVDTRLLEFPSQQFYEYFDPPSQSLVAIQCAHKAILEYLNELGEFLNLKFVSIPSVPPGLLAPDAPENTISAYSRLRPSWDEIVLNCYSSTAVRLTLYALTHDTCGQDSGATQAPIIPDDVPERVPEDEPLEISPPYDETNESEPYAPNPIDIPPEPPEPELQGTQCARYRLQISYQYSGQPVFTTNPTIFGEFSTDIEVRADGVPVSLPYTMPPDDPNGKVITFWVLCRSREATCGELRRYMSGLTLSLSVGTTLQFVNVTQITPL